MKTKSKKSGKTFRVLEDQLKKVLHKKLNKDNLIIAYEPIWSIGTGQIPSDQELKKLYLI